MHVNVARAIAALGLLTLPLSIVSQQVEIQAGVTGSSVGQTMGARAIKLAPYTAQFKTTTVKTLADGTTITREFTETRARDSQGRTMSSRNNPNPLVATLPPFSSFNVHDPVEGTQTTWNTNSKHAQAIKLPQQSQRQGCWATDSGNMKWNYGPSVPRTTAAQINSAAAPAVKGSAPVRSESEDVGTEVVTTAQIGSSASPAAIRQARVRPDVEDLGTETIQDLETHGTRSTTTIPAGQIGNDKALVTVHEEWIAPNIGVVVRRINDSPQNGKTTMELVSIDLTEPPLTTFQPPDGYEVTSNELHQVQCPKPGQPWQ